MKIVNYGRKKVYNIGPRSCTTWPGSTSITEKKIGDTKWSQFVAKLFFHSSVTLWQNKLETMIKWEHGYNHSGLIWVRPGYLTISNGREPRSCLGRVFKLKLGSLTQ